MKGSDPDLDTASENQEARDAERAPRLVSRRTLVGATVASALLSFLGANTAEAQQTPTPGSGEDETQKDLRERIEHLMQQPLSLQALDALGVVCFSDAMYALIAKKDSVVQKLFVGLRLPTYNTGKLDHSRGHKDKFPLENMYLASLLNALRATAFGEEVREETVHELHTAVQGVALLMGLTSVARGIFTASHASEITETTEESIHKHPEETIADSIFQLTVLSAATQIPLTSFGNAAIGNHEFREIRTAFETIYLERLLPNPEGEFAEAPRDDVGRESIIAYIREQLQQTENPIVQKRVESVLQNPELLTHEQFTHALRQEATAHTHDLVTLLMATSCDDAQAAAGDPGPLIGLFQTFGIDFIHVIPAMIPFTIYVGIERASVAAKRAGLQTPIITVERMKYMAAFLRETWKNLLKYFATAAPKISSKIAGTERTTRRSDDSDGVDFSLLEQVLKDAEAAIMTVLDAIVGSFHGRTLDVRKVREAVELLQESNREWKIKVGDLAAERIFPVRKDETTITKEEVISIQHGILGRKAPRKQPYHQDKQVEELNDLQIELSKIAAAADDETITAFASHLNEIKKNHGPELELAIRESLKQQGDKPAILAAAMVLKDNPLIKDLLDFNYWHDRIGPALTDTMFVVFLQGLHMSFLISTTEKVVYKARWFNALPLLAQEQLSILLNYALGMFADNWADTVAHSKWLTTLYFGQLDRELRELLSEHPSATKRLDSGYYQDDSTAHIPDRFTARITQTAALIEHMKSRAPAEAVHLENKLQGYIENARKYYCRNLVIAMEIGVIGAGNSLPGDSTHFTYAAGQKDFTFAVTLGDFKRHPLFHVYKLLWGSAYAIYVGPALAQLMGGGVQKDMQTLLQEKFRTRFPGFEDKLRELEQGESANADQPKG